MNRPKVSLTILLPWEKTMAYCWGRTIQIYYSPHSFSAKTKRLAPICRLLEHLRTTTHQEENVRVKTVTESFGRERKGRNSAWKVKFRKCLCKGICAKGAMVRHQGTIGNQGLEKLKEEASHCGMTGMLRKGRLSIDHLAWSACEKQLLPYRNLLLFWKMLW